MEHGETSKQPTKQGDEMNNILMQEEMFGERDDFPFKNYDNANEIMQIFADCDAENNQNNNNNNNNAMILASNQGGENSEIPQQKKYQRHNAYQIQQLEAVFRVCPHPDERQRIELSQRLGLNLNQIKFWFQNKRTQIKTQTEHNQYILLREENDRLRNENATLKAVLSQTSLPPMSLKGKTKITENAQHYFAHASNVAGNIGFQNAGITSNNYSSVPGTAGTSSIRPGVGKFSGGDRLGLPENSSGNHMTGAGVLNNEPGGWMIGLAHTAMSELLRMTDERNTSLWIKGSDGSREVLNYNEYIQTYPPIFSVRPSHFANEATRDTAVVQSPCKALVHIFMDSERWTKTFPSLIATASTIQVLSSGTDGTKNGTLQLMEADYQVLSPMVPLCKVKFIRYCKQYAVGKWAVLDVSADTVFQIRTEEPFMAFRQLPSGCIIEEFPNGCSKVTWVTHYEYDESAVNHLYRPMLRAGLGSSSTVWLARLMRRCSCMAYFSPSALAARVSRQAISDVGKRGLLNLGQRMSDYFCYGVCSSKFQWVNIQNGSNENNNVFIRSRISADDPGEPSGIVLSGMTSLWLPVTRQNLFDHLRMPHQRNQWDTLCESEFYKMLHMNKAQDNNEISVFRSSNPDTMVVLQETWTDASASFIAYAPLERSEIYAVLEGKDSASISVLPSGFAIHSDGKMGISESGGSLLTIGFQVLAKCDHAMVIDEESLNVLKSLIIHTSSRIKEAMGCA